MTDSDDHPQPLTLAESIRRKIAEAQASGVRTPPAESKEASDDPLLASAATLESQIDNLRRLVHGSEPQEGSVLGAYNLVKLIHSGNTARIFVAQHSLLDRKLVAKILKNEHNSNTYMVKRLQEEARALSALKNNHVVEVHDFSISTAGHPYIILEHVEAPSLRELLDSKERRPDTFSIQIIEQLGDALSDAHKHGIKYANLKPEHVLVEQSSQTEVCVKLVDFFSIYRDELLPPVLPTFDVAPFMSPEQIAGRPPQQQSDIYSLACLAFETLGGAPPYREESLGDYAEAHLTKTPEKTDGLSDHAYKVLLKAMDKEPDRRHETVQEFVTALKNALLSGT